MAQAERCVKPEAATPFRPRTSHMEPSGLATAGGGRYVLYGEIASGGMASVQYGKLLGPHGFTRPVAIKRLHPHFAKEAEFLSMFIDEARLSARLVHANIIHTLDVIQAPGEIALVMEYVHGESLWTLLRLARDQGRPVPLAVASALIASTLHGLHAAHEARGDDGEPLQIVHRDVSPPNILIGSDGIPRVLDFGIAKALGRMHATPSGEIKGKLGYIAPEQLHAAHVDRRTDVYGAAAVLWEALTGSRLFDGPSEPAVVHRVLYATVDAPSVHRADVPPELDAIVCKGLSRDMDARFASAQEMALAIERSTRLASQSEIAAWLEGLAGPQLSARAQRLSTLSHVQTSGERATPAGLQPAAAHGTRRIPPAAAPETPDDAKTIVIASDDPILQPRRTRAWAISAAVALLAITVAAWAVSAAPTSDWWRSGDRPETTVAPASEPPQPIAAEIEEGLAPPPLPAATPTHEEPKHPGRRTSNPRAATASSAAEHATVLEKPVAPVAPAVSARPPPPAAVRGSAATPPADPCVPFYRIDERGIRHPKPECL